LAFLALRGRPEIILFQGKLRFLNIAKCMHETVKILMVFGAFRAIIAKSTPKAFKFVRFYKGCATHFFDEREKLFPPRNTKGVQRRELRARNSVNTNGFRCLFSLYSPKASRKSSDSTGFIRVAQLISSMNGKSCFPLRNTKGVQRRELRARNSVNTNGFRCLFSLYSPKASRKSSDSTGFIRVAQLNASMNGNAVSPKEY
jgi:hypothetical protein